MRSALVIGADGAIGSALLARLKREKIEATGTTAETLNLADPASWPALPKADVAYLCAAISKLDACEQNPKAARKVNVEGTSALAKKLHDAGSFVVFLSSNQVFDGTKPQRKAGDPPCPVNEYGRQKAETEKAILAPGGGVLRLTKVIVPGDSRIKTWHDTLKQNQPVTAFDDIFLAPVTLDNVLDALIQIGRDRSTGIHQISGYEDFSYYDLARAIARSLGKDESLVARGSGSAADVPANFRPRYSSYARQFKDIDVPGIDGIVAYALDK